MQVNENLRSVWNDLVFSLKKKAKRDASPLPKWIKFNFSPAKEPRFTSGQWWIGVQSLSAGRDLSSLAVAPMRHGDIAAPFFLSFHW